MISDQLGTTEVAAVTKLREEPLLPENLANMVTVVSLATRISLRCSSLFFDAVFEAAKYGTSLSLGLSRTALTSALVTAKKLHSSSNQIAYNSSSTLKEQERLHNSNNLFIKVLEKYTDIGLYVVSHTFSLTELFAMSGLQFTSRTIQSSLKAAEESVRIVDGIFGSNETSRAIASIITLVHRELRQDPDFALAKSGRVAILAGLTKAFTAFAVLQNVTHKRMMKQIPMTVIWEGLVTEEKDEDEKNGHIIQFKKKEKRPHHITKSMLCDDTVIMQELSAILQQQIDKDNDNGVTICNQNDSNTFKVTTKTTCITTKTTAIYPIDSIYSKKVTIRSNEEESGAYLALHDKNNSSVTKKKKFNFILTALQEKRRKRKVERQEEINVSYDENNGLVQPQTYNYHRRRFSSPDYNTTDKEMLQKKRGRSFRQVHASSSSCLITDGINISQKRSNSISSCSSNGSGAASTTTTSLAMTTTTYNSPIPTPSQSNITNNYYIAEDDNITYYDHGWNFPRNHIVNNIAHFMKYASAAYGESFMRILGIGDIPTVLPSSHHHHPNHHAFAHHTGNSVEDILLSSYTDRSPLHLHNPSIHALVHYVTVDHAAKAIVLTCRGTLGLSDILTDLSFDYSSFHLPHDKSKVFKAHSGMLDAAQLLAKEKGKVYQKIYQGLEQFPDYGLVMCGHSLGGGVASLLCVLWSQQIENTASASSSTRKNCLKLAPSFVTSTQSGLPAGRPIHCYAYGPPGVMSLELSVYCAGLVSSVVHGYDIVSSLSFGLLKDFKNIATSLHAEGDVAEEIISRVVGRLQKKKQQPGGRNASKGDKEQDDDELTEDDQWFWAMIKTMRADMKAEKMYPPNTVYLIESIPQVKQQHKVTLTRCEDVEARFSEIVFSRTMFMDHSPLMYERAVRKLCKGYTETL